MCFPSGSFIIILFVFLGANVGAIAFMYHTFPEGEAEMFRTELKVTHKGEILDHVSTGKNHVTNKNGKQAYHVSTVRTHVVGSQKVRFLMSMVEKRENLSSAT